MLLVVRGVQTLDFYTSAVSLQSYNIVFFKMKRQKTQRNKKICFISKIICSHFFSTIFRKIENKEVKIKNFYRKYHKTDKTLNANTDFSLLTKK